MKIVVDSGNGIPGASAPAILRALGCEVIDLYSRGRRRLPQPPSRPQQAGEPGRPDQGRAGHRRRARPGLRRRRRPPRRRHRGRPRSSIPDRQLMLFARDILQRNRGATDHLRRQVHAAPGGRRSAQAGGKPLMWKTGHSLIKAKLKETGAPIAGEMSGHIFFNERWYGFDDATYTAARLLEILSRQRRPERGARTRCPPASRTPELNVPCAEGEHHAVIDDAAQRQAPLRGARATDHHRRPARRLRRRLRPGPRHQHHAGAGAALRRATRRRRCDRIEETVHGGAARVKPDASRARGH